MAFCCHQILPNMRHDFNRRILKTVCPVVWEGSGAQSSVPDPINGSVKGKRTSSSALNIDESFALGGARVSERIRVGSTTIYGCD
jgi:hypothetical protein